MVNKAVAASYNETGMDPESTLKAYDAIAPVYREYSNKKQAYLDAVDALVVKKLKSGMRLLDVGAGDGRRLAKIRDEAGITDIVAVEPSAEMARVCEERTGITVRKCFGEDLDKLDIGSFDAITALWNVFGHISPSAARLSALRHMAAKLNPGGVIMLDVNNRHNAAAYGRLKALGRIILDTVCFDETRGDASYEWKIGDQSFQASGHLFTPSEIEKLFRQAGLKIAERCSLNYLTGAVSQSPYRGQLFYILNGEEGHAG